MRRRTGRLPSHRRAVGRENANSIANEGLSDKPGLEPFGQFQGRSPADHRIG